MTQHLVLQKNFELCSQCLLFMALNMNSSLKSNVQAHKKNEFLSLQMKAQSSETDANDGFLCLWSLWFPTLEICVSREDLLRAMTAVPYALAIHK